jgi:hypothetical protein
MNVQVALIVMSVRPNTLKMPRINANYALQSSRTALTAQVPAYARVVRKDISSMQIIDVNCVIV